MRNLILSLQVVILSIAMPYVGMWLKSAKFDGRDFAVFVWLVTTIILFFVILNAVYFTFEHSEKEIK